MPRAYYKPFTAYEEALGYHAVRRNAYILCGLFFGGLLFKIALVRHYGTGDMVGTSETRAHLSTQADVDAYEDMIRQREELSSALWTRDNMKQSMTRRRNLAPPA